MTVDIRENLRQVRERMSIAAARSGRSARDVALTVVTKGVSVDVMRKAIDEGCVELGESRAQELLAKRRRLNGIHWHFIGHLQRNKVRSLIEHVVLIHSLDRWSLAEEINRCAQACGLVMPVLLQVNISRETTKYGMDINEVPDMAAAAAALPGLSVQGLMTLAPWADDPEKVRPIFRELRLLGQRLATTPGFALKYLSMGMSNDYTVAIEEGANLVRIGTAIFAGRSADNENKGRFTGGG